MTPAPISVDGAPAKVHRYDPRITPNLKTGRVDYDGMAAFPNGKWVLHSDYAALLQQLAEREADLEREQGVREDAQRQLRAAERAREGAVALVARVVNNTYWRTNDNKLWPDLIAFLAASGGNADG